MFCLQRGSFQRDKGKFQLWGTTDDQSTLFRQVKLQKTNQYEKGIDQVPSQIDDRKISHQKTRKRSQAFELCYLSLHNLLQNQVKNPNKRSLPLRREPLQPKHQQHQCLILIRLLPKHHVFLVKIAIKQRNQVCQPQRLHGLQKS